MSTILEHPEGTVQIDERDGRLAIAVDARPGQFIPVGRWETRYSLELIEHVLSVKGPDYLCDEIMRDESPSYVQHHFHWDILSYATPEAFAGKRILDFGSGSGASSMVLARMFPDATIVGVELVAEYVELARHRARFHGVDDRVTFLLSPDPSELPEIGEFDAVIFSAVFEHLLPAERTQVLPLLWSHVRPGGMLFLDQTPYRWFPIELHTTGLPLINYLPDRLTLECARRFSKRVNRDVTWDELLRKGVRGGTPAQIVGILQGAGGRAELVEPSQLGVTDRVDLWFRVSSGSRHAKVKSYLKTGLQTARKVTGVTMTPSLSLAIRKLG